MYRLYGIATQNTFKCAYVLEEIGVEYEFRLVNLAGGEQKTPEFLAINPIGKVPALKHGDFSVAESGAICRYVASSEESALYPADVQLRGQVDQWLDFMPNHLGRWLSTLFFEKVLKQRFNRGDADPAKCAEATEFAKQQFGIVDSHLKNSKYFAGDSLTIADLCAVAYIEQVLPIDFSISDYPHVEKWLQKMLALESVQRAKKKVTM